MRTVDFNMYQALAVAAVMLILGQLLVNRIDFLKRYCIPAPVVGGLIFAIAHCILRSAGIVEFNMDDTLQKVFMTAFFCSVGYQAAFSMLKKGGIGVLKFLFLAVAMCVLQDLVGGFGAKLFGLDARMGLCMGSIPLVGGHGTSGSFGPFLEERGVVGATTVAIASATYGLISGCLIGGPIAAGKIRKYHLHSTAKITQTEQTVEKDENTGMIDSSKMLNATLYIVIAVGLGTVVTALFGRVLTVPGYIGAMVVAAIIRNVADSKKIAVPMDEINSLGNVCLSLFLGMAMISLKLWQLIDLAIPMIVILLIQTVIMYFYASFVVFGVMGRDYDAATIASGFCGFGMGATPNAMANMQAVTRQFGPAPVAFMIVPLVGSLFIDFFNATIITAFANFL
ncbi:sodium/glutamate symporter [Clostridium vitabionis]|uniref:sodium/glutamate symporter n=1 Tax=Clostridium vitabionis TaxID=2784388 RepID=UPI00188D6878|nr:sodium/glutamate symporter [Clostridium vitabionis]